MNSSIGRLGMKSRWVSIVTLVGAGYCTLPGCSRSETEHNNAPVLVTDSAPKDLHATNVEFDGKLRLLGYTTTRRPWAIGKPASVTMYWQAKEKLPAGYRPVTRLLDDAGERIIDLDSAGPLREEKDGKPVLPIESWQPGKIYVDEISFTVPRAVKSWKVQIVSGFTKGEENLKVTDGESLDGLALVASSSTGVRSRGHKPPAVPNLRVDVLDPKVKLKIDGKLDEEAWKDAPQATLVDPASGKEPKQPGMSGNVRLLSSAQGFYVGFEVKEANVVGGFEKGAKDAHLWTKDAVEIMVDPDGDGDNLDYYEIQINPQGLVFDTQYDKYNEPRTEPDGPFGHQEWSSNVKSAVTVQGTIDKPDDTDQGYVVEAFVPWKSFDKAKKTPPATGDTWRLNFYAIKENDGVSWSPILKQGNFHKASRFGRVLWAEKGWAPPAPLAALAGSAAPLGSAAPGSSGATALGAPKPMPSGLVERLQSARTRLQGTPIPVPSH
jgi:hypothetical protein